MTKIYGVNLCIHSKYEKIQTRKNSVFGNFLCIDALRCKQIFLKDDNKCKKKTYCGKYKKSDLRSMAFIYLFKVNSGNTRTMCEIVIDVVLVS